MLLFFLHQPLVDQKSVARTNGQEYLLWDYFKYSYNDNPPKLTTTIDAYGLYTFKVQEKIEQFFGCLMYNDVVFTYNPLAFDSIKLYGDGPVSFAMHAAHQLNRMSDEGKD